MSCLVVVIKITILQFFNLSMVSHSIYEKNKAKNETKTK